MPNGCPLNAGLTGEDGTVRPFRNPTPDGSGDASLAPAAVSDGQRQDSEVPR
jgi:hypothetical protein